MPVDSRTDAGRTPLMSAAMQGHVSLAAMLIDRGADRNPVDATGNTIEDLMKARRSLIEFVLDEYNSSRAWHPTEELEAELALLARNQQVILALLGR